MTYNLQPMEKGIAVGLKIFNFLQEHVNPLELCQGQKSEDCEAIAQILSQYSFFGLI